MLDDFANEQLMRMCLFSYAQICIDSIFPEGEDVKTCISRAADSISLKEMPSYEVKMGEQFDWIKKTQVNLLVNSVLSESIS